MAMLDPEIAAQFGIDGNQSAKFVNNLEGRGALVRSMGAEAATAEINKRLLEVLTDPQKTHVVHQSGTAPSVARTVAAVDGNANANTNRQLPAYSRDVAPQGDAVAMAAGST